MKNYLCAENLISSTNESLNKVIQSSSAMDGYPITNILVSEEKTIWLSTEELPQEITINLYKSLFKEFPKKISSIGIYCWHAYNTNPKLIEVQISKNKGKNFFSLGNFDLCLKPGKQLLQLEDDSNCFLSKDIANDNLVLKLIIKETFGDKRTYINNIYLYEDINIFGKKLLTSMEPIKEEDSNSMIYLRESRERTLPKSGIKAKANNLIYKNNNLKDILDMEFDSKSEDEKKKSLNQKNENKILGIESEFMMSDSELSEKINMNNFEDKKRENITSNKGENKLINNQELNSSLNENKNNFKNNQRYFMEKMLGEELNYNKLISGNEEQNEAEEKEKSLKIDDFDDDDNEEDNNKYNENINENNINNVLNNYEYNNNIQNYMEKEIDEHSNNSYREEELNLLIEEFQNYKKFQKQKVINYERKINYLENQFKEMTFLSNKMNSTINTILESQMNQKKENHDYLLNTMRKIINEKVTKVFSNFHNFNNFCLFYSPYRMQNQYNNPYNFNTIGNPIFDFNRNIINNKIIKRYKMKSEKKYLKAKYNTISVRKKSGQKSDYRKNSINSYNNAFNNEEANENDLLSNNNIYKAAEYDNENEFQDYPLQMGLYSENDIQNFPFFIKNQKKKPTSIHHNNSSRSLVLMNNNRQNYNRLNTDNNDYAINNRTQKVVNNGRFSANQNFGYIKNINMNNYFSENNEIAQNFDEIKNNTSKKIVKPSNLKSENYLKGNNKNEMNKAFPIKDKNAKKGNNNNQKKVDNIKIDNNNKNNSAKKKNRFYK